MSIAEGAFHILSGMLQSRAGVVLGREKSYFLESRLLPVATRAGLRGVDDLAVALTRAGSETLAAEAVEAMLNNETFFYRDTAPFDLLRRTVLPELRQTRQSLKTLRIWCAAASTGQEPYSIAMMFADDAAAWAGWRIEIVATDLSRRALDRAENGLYSQFEVQRGLPIQSLVRHFDKEGEQWRLARDVRQRVRFRQANLCHPFAHLGRFDVVLCRNVLMYFDLPTRSDILARIRKQMPEDGCLLLGAAETVLGLDSAFRPDWENRGLYRIDATEPRRAA
ncbi:CheR family methyltransferase [Sphingoaurantiacus capsulatus]|uniref:protein-glutamate O-methyltransferase n=1 Tax=Sphingoaurantiacus capsulatus TaxID=1771310 RepID=A0ABV7XDE5_9SPHN